MYTCYHQVRRFCLACLLCCTEYMWRRERLEFEEDALCNNVQSLDRLLDVTDLRIIYLMLNWRGFCCHVFALEYTVQSICKVLAASFAKEYTVFSPVMLIISCTCPYVYHLPVSPWFPGGCCPEPAVCLLEFKQKNPKNKSVATVSPFQQKSHSWAFFHMV